MTNKLIHRKERIIISTIEVLDRVGIQNLSTKLIAQQEGVSEGTLFRHFKNKDEILLATIDHFGQFDHAIMATCRQQDLAGLDAIRCFFRALAEYYQNYPQITALNQLYGELMYDEALLGKIEALISKREDFIGQMLDQAKSEKSISSESDSSTMAEMILDVATGIILKWRWQEYTFSIKEETMARIEILIGLFTGKD